MTMNVYGDVCNDRQCQSLFLGSPWLYNYSRLRAFNVPSQCTQVC